MDTSRATTLTRWVRLALAALIAFVSLALPFVAVTPAQAAVTGTEDWVTLLCRYSDIPDTPHPVSYYEELMSGVEPGMAHYWSDTSYGAYKIGLRRVRGWYTLPHSAAFYASLGEDQSQVRMTNDCAGLADPQVDFALYEGINIFVNGGGGALFSRGIRMTLNPVRDGATQTFRVTRVKDEGEGTQYNLHKQLAHEMGHTFGLLHSSGLGFPGTPYPGDYDSDWDVMSAGGLETMCGLPSGRGARQYPEPFGCIAIHPSGAQKELLGWIPAGRKLTLPVGSQATVTLERLSEPGLSGYLLAKIPIGGAADQFYTVEARRRVGYDANIPGEGVIISRVDLRPARERISPMKVLVVDADNNGNVNDAGAIWLPGETFSDLANGITVRVEADTGTGWRIFVSHQPAISIADVSVHEPPLGGGFPEPDPGDATTIARFTVRLSQPSSRTVTVNYATRDGTAKAPADYFATQGTLTFPAGTTSRAIDVIVLADRVDDPTETYFVDLSNPVNAVIADGRGTGRILPP